MKVLGFNRVALGVIEDEIEQAVKQFNEVLGTDQPAPHTIEGNPAKGPGPVGSLVRAAPDESVEIRLLVGTASIVPGLGDAVLPGRWAVQAILGLGDAGIFRTPLLPTSVIA